MSMIFILIQNKFDIDKNNDKLFKTIWEYKKKEKKSWSSPEMNNNIKPKLVDT
jgi:hypothetical protein